MMSFKIHLFYNKNPPYLIKICEECLTKYMIERNRGQGQCNEGHLIVH